MKKEPLNINDWEKVYYPKVATERMNTLQAARHCLKKWLGLYPSVLKKYNLGNRKYRLYSINDDPYVNTLFRIDQTTCALCVKFFNRDCKNCPIAKADKPCGSYDSIFQKYLDTGNPSLMIKLLKKIVKELGN